MKYHSVVPLNSAKDVEKPIPRVRLNKLSPEVRRICDNLFIFDGDTMHAVRLRIEEHMKLLNVEQRQRLLRELARVLE